MHEPSSQQGDESAAQPAPQGPSRDFDLTTGPVSRRIRQIAVPASVGIFFHTMYNVVDTYFGGKISTTALAALSLSFPVFFLLYAVGSGLAVGSTSLIANELGKGDQAAARRMAVQGVSFCICASLALLVLGLVLAPWLFGLLGAEGDYLRVCLDYINPMFLGSTAFLLVYMANAVLQAVGDTRSYRNFLILGFVLNCGLDPWFVFGGLGVPAMGITGVAVATVLIQIVGAAYLGWRACRTGVLCLRNPRDLVPSWRPFKEIAKQGFPASINYMTIGLGIFVITYFLSRFGEHAVAGYGIATRVEQIALMPTIGLNIATLSIVAQNNGAGKLDRMREAVAKALKYGAVLMGLGTVLVFSLARTMMGLFTEDAAVIGAGSQYLRIAAFVLYAYVVLFVIVAALQGVKRPMYAIWIGVFRQVAAPVGLMYLLTVVLGAGLPGVWWSIFSITWFAAGITVLYAALVWRRMQPGAGSGPAAHEPPRA